MWRACCLLLALAVGTTSAAAHKLDFKFAFESPALRSLQVLQPPIRALRPLLEPCSDTPRMVEVSLTIAKNGTIEKVGLRRFRGGAITDELRGCLERHYRTVTYPARKQKTVLGFLMIWTADRR